MKTILSTISKPIRSIGVWMDNLGSNMSGNTDKLCRHRRVLGFKDLKAKLSAGSWVAPNATIVGDVNVGINATIWYNAVIKGINNKIEIGQASQIFDGVIVDGATKIGENTLIFSGSYLNNCTIGDDVIIEMGVTIEDGAVIENKSKISAGSRITSGTVVKSGQLWEGSPAIYTRDLTESDYSRMNNLLVQSAQIAEINAQEQNKNTSERQNDYDRYKYLFNRKSLYQETPF